MYEPVEKKPHFPTLERRILELWQQTRAFELLREKNRGGPRWSFLDGPITANNPMGVHHAWGRSLKDMFQRFHAMCGHELRYQNGFDCQGLWVEVEVEKEHGFTSKRDIEAYGVARFVADCKARVEKYSGIQSKQSIRLGYWMDWSNSYYTMAEENNYTIWSFLKRCHERGAVSKGLDSMPWCPRCGVGLSEMEMHEGYKWVEDLSVFVRFPLRGRDHEALLVWTTTPWTLTSNVAAAVNPEMQYHKVRQGEWTYYVGAENWQGARRIEVEEASGEGKVRREVKLATLPKLLGRHGEVEVVDTVAGSELIGLEYDGPFDHLEAQQTPGGYPQVRHDLMHLDGRSCHRVIEWDAVTGHEGTGIVHIAPGCGKEDFQLGRELGLVSLSPLDETGHFLERFGWLSGRHAQELAEEIAADLDKRGLLIGQEHYPHRYAHCWRCGNAVLYRLVDEWFISMDWRQEIMDLVPQIRWIPDYGAQREMDWLRNMGDWMISKKRYWGLALPIWQCDRHAAASPDDRCDWFTVIGSRQELEERATAGLEQLEGQTPHRPYIDAVKITCERCGAQASRIADVGNPWLDAGIVPYSTMGYNSDRAYWEQWFPPELVLECFPGQFRNWFYALLAMNTMMQDERWADRTGGASEVRPPFKTLLGHALVFDEQGREMHKSWGNAIEFNTAAETIGAESMRYIYAAQNPTTNLRFPDISSDRDPKVVHRDQEVQRTLLTLWNCYSFYVTYASVDGITPADLEVPLEERSELDRWILSKLQELIRFARECFTEYRIHLLIGSFEAFLEDLSNWYLRRSRRRFWKSESDTDKLAAYATLFETLETLCRLMAPVLPFLTEEIYQVIVHKVSPGSEPSIHLQPYPEVDAERVDRELVQRIDVVVRYKNLGLALRNQASLKVRQPLARLLIKPADEVERQALSQPGLIDQLLSELNIKQLELVDTVENLVQTEIRPDFKVLGPRYGSLMKQIQKELQTVDAAELQRTLAAGSHYPLKVGETEVLLGADEVLVRHTAPEGLAFTIQDERFVALDTVITPELEREGQVRDLVRGIQEERKRIDLDVADRIRLRYHGPEAIVSAVSEWSEYITRETLAASIETDEALEGSGTMLKVAGMQVHIAIEKIDAA